MARYVIHLEGHTATLNELSRSVRLKIQLKKRDRAWVTLACRSQDVVRAEGKRRVTVTVVLGPGQRAADVDAFWKSLLDAMKHAGAIKNDSPRWVELMPVVYERGTKSAMQIVLDDIDVEVKKPTRRGTR